MLDQSDDIPDDEIGQAGEQMASIATVCQIVDANDSETNKTGSVHQSPHATLISDLPNNKTASSPRKTNKTNHVRD